MALRDLIPWRKRGRDLEVRPRAEHNPVLPGREENARHGEERKPFLSLHNEMDRLFDEAFRSFDLMSFGSDRVFDRAVDLPNIEISETDQEVRVMVKLHGLEEKDLHVEFADGVLIIKGEKRSETKDEGRRYSERRYGRFERRIPIDYVDEDNVVVIFKSGVLTVTLRKVAGTQKNIRLI
jgi:HSP20 family protein